ncbi:MAG TPA: TonB-dependent receptor [Alphaproteobacteria bacterium]|nr:TonB-dependent receptor [Alphaproteobacteria bacterium]
MSTVSRSLTARQAVSTLAILFAQSLLPSLALADDTAPPTAASPALTQGTPLTATEMPPIVVSATRLPTPEEQLGSSVTVITSEDIEHKQARTLPEVLQDVPGLNLVQIGSLGGTTSVFMRGTNANHTKVFLDGIEVSDPSSVDGSFDFSQVLASDIDRIEVLRGPQSGLYGSDAIGGVINIITKSGSGPAKVRASIEGGSFATFNQTAGTSGSVSRFHYTFDFSHFHTGGTRVTPTNLVPAGRPVNDDSYDNKTYATKLGADLTDNFDVGVVTRLTQTALTSTSDDSLGPEAIPSDSDNREFFTRGTAHLSLFDGVFDQTAGVGYTDYRRRFFNPNATDIANGNDPSFFRGNRTKLDWQGNVHVMPGQIVTLGAEHQIDRIDDSSPVQADMSNNAGFAQLQSSFGDRFFNAANVRYDDNDRFGNKATYRDAPAVLFPETGTKLKGSVGTGFKAPTLDQLFDNFPQFGFFANPNLIPETSIGYDAGFEQGLLDKRVQFGATYFHNDIKNLITTNAAGASYENVGRATTYGVESFVAYRPWDPLSLRADYTYTRAENDILHEELTRRPKNKASLNATWQATDNISFSGTVLYVGPWIDSNRAGTVTGLTANGYTLVNLAASYELRPGVTTFARINNLLDKQYQDPIGFQHQGFGIFAGLRVAFDALDAINWPRLFGHDDQHRM